MPFIADTVSPERPIVGVVAALAGMRVDAFAPRTTDTAGVPTPSHVVAWALVRDELEPGGSVLEPVFFAAGRTWTPDQFKATYGQDITVEVVPG